MAKALVILPADVGDLIALTDVMSTLLTIRPPGDPAEAPALPEIAITALQDPNPAEGAGPHFLRLEVRLDAGQFGNAMQQRQGSLYLGAGAARRVAAALERALGRGCRFVSPERAPVPPHHSALNLQATLTAREREVLQLLAAGSTARESSTLLGISPRTVEFHRENLKEKLQVRSIAELTCIAVDAGMVHSTAWSAA
jgi:DNA-binding CsgD family transcriptional regulator